MSWSQLAVIPVLSVLLLVHELGHFLAARRAGITVEEFGIGLPPRLFGVNAGRGHLLPEPHSPGRLREDGGRERGGGGGNIREQEQAGTRRGAGGWTGDDLLTF